MLNFAVPYHSIGKNIEYRYTAQPEFQLEMLVSHAAFLEKLNLNVYVAISIAFPNTHVLLVRSIIYSYCECFISGGEICTFQHFNMTVCKQ